MEKLNNLQHYQVPNNMSEDGITPKDQLIYLSIKAFDGKNGCFPSLLKISLKSGASIPTIRVSIDKLKDTGYIKVEKKGRNNYYIFNNYKKFEPFSPEFLDNQNISFTTKSYLIASQQYMYKDVEGLGKISFSNYELAKQINMPESTIRKCNKELERKNYLEILKNVNTDIETKCNTDTKLFRLNDLGQAVIWALCDHEDRIQQNSEDIKRLKQQLENQNKLIKKLLEERNIDSKTFIL